MWKCINNCLKTKYPFVYCIQGKYYYIGLGVFRVCNETEIQNYEAFAEEMKRVELLNYPLEKRDVGELIRLFEIVRNVPNVESDYVTKGKSEEQLELMLEKCSAEELELLCRQKELFVKALDYKDGAFYRHSKK